MTTTPTAREALDRFFSGKEMHCGGPVPKYLLHDPRRLQLVAALSLRAAYVLAYQHLVEGHKPLDVSHVICLLQRSGVPAECYGGLLLSYLEFCEGEQSESFRNHPWPVLPGPGLRQGQSPVCA